MVAPAPPRTFPDAGPSHARTIPPAPEATMSSELREALTAAGASALVPKIIDANILEYMRRFAPLLRAIPSQQWDTDVYNFNTRTQLAVGGAVVDGGAVPVSNSTYVQSSFQMRHLQIIGAVTGYAQAVTRLQVGDLRRREIDGSITGLLWDTENMVTWGNSASTVNGARPQFDGLDTLVSVFSGAYQNSLDKGGNTLTTPHLDQLISMVQTNVSMPLLGSSWMFVMSSSAESKISQLMQNQQRFNDKVQIAPGLLVDSYRNIPIVLTSFLSPQNFSMGTVTGSSTTATTYGTPAIPNSTTYRYVLAPVIARQGEILPCPEVTITTSSSGPYTNTLSFSTPTGQDSAQPISYKVYRTAAAGGSNSETFLGYVDGTVGLAADSVTPILTVSIADTGTALVPYNSSTVPGVLPTQYYGTNAGLYPLAAGLENIYLVPRNRDFMLRPYVRDMATLDVYPTTTSPDSMPYAIQTDCTLAIRAPRYVGRLARVATSV
jgi:hypothetical protein